MSSGYILLRDGRVEVSALGVKCVCTSNKIKTKAKADIVHVTLASKMLFRRYVKNRYHYSRHVVVIRFVTNIPSLYLVVIVLVDIVEYDAVHKPCYARYIPLSAYLVYRSISYKLKVKKFVIEYDYQYAADIMGHNTVLYVFVPFDSIWGYRDIHKTSELPPEDEELVDKFIYSIDIPELDPNSFESLCWYP